MSSDFQVSDLLNSSGRLPYNELLRVIHKTSRTVFVSKFTHPVFIGESLYSGEIHKAEVRDMTMQFDFSEQIDDMGSDDKPDSSGLQRAVYPLVKTHLSKSPYGIYTVGRVRGNDMVMVDFVISRAHAEIHISYEEYFLKDLKSRNGCTINGEKIPPGEKCEFHKNDKVGFARYQFHFIGAEELFDRLEKL